MKQRIYPMLGFKNFGNAAMTISVVELAQKIRKRQFDTSAVIVKEEVSLRQVWDAVLTA